MKRIKYLLSLFAVISLFGCIGSVNASDAVVTNDTANHEFTISRSINGVTNNVSNTYTYKVEAKSSNLPGVTGIPTGATIEFDDETPSSNKVTKTAKLDFLGAKFTKNGDYEYIVSEFSSSDQANYPIDTEHKYTIQISVRNSPSNINEKTIIIYGYSGEGDSMSKLDDGSGPGSGTTLDFETETDYTNITFKGNVEGNMASIDEYFPIKVTINGTPGDTYTITGQTKPGASTTYTVGEENIIYVKHGETVTIGKNGATNQIPKDISYNFVVQSPDGYETYINGSTTDSKTSGNLSTSDPTNNTFVNKYAKDALTGKYLSVLPYLLIIILSLTAVIYMIMRKKPVEE